jgi:hypothetical protein
MEEKQSGGAASGSPARSGAAAQKSAALAKEQSNLKAKRMSDSYHSVVSRFW